jgi:hypothetical protein
LVYSVQRDWMLSMARAPHVLVFGVDLSAP